MDGLPGDHTGARRDAKFAQLSRECSLERFKNVPGMAVFETCCRQPTPQFFTIDKSFRVFLDLRATVRFEPEYHAFLVSGVWRS